MLRNTRKRAPRINQGTGTISWTGTGAAQPTTGDEATMMTVSVAVSGTLRQVVFQPRDASNNAVGNPVVAPVINGVATATVVRPLANSGNTIAAIPPPTPAAPAPTSVVSSTFTTTASNAVVVAEWAYEAATSSPDATVVQWGEGLPKGKLWADEIIGIRNKSSQQYRILQFEPQTFWDDGSVKTFHGAFESETGNDGSFKTYELIRGTRAAPGSDLDFSAALSSRTFSVTVTPSTGSPYTWSTLKADILASTDVWLKGPLVECRRATVAIPSANFGSVTSARFVCDVYAFKDGTIRVAAALRNDGFYAAAGGETFAAWKITVDGTDVFTQASDRLPQYMWWYPNHIGLTRYAASATARPVGDVKPNNKLMAQAAVTHQWDAEGSPDFSVQTSLYTGQSQYMTETNPFASWSIYADSPSVSGRPEIGFRTYPQWLYAVTGDRQSRRFMLGMARKAMNKPVFLWNAALGRIPTVEDMPNLWVGGATVSVGSTALANATGFPTGQQHQIGADGSHFAEQSTQPQRWSYPDHAHNGSYHALPGLWTCDRHFYDAHAARTAWGILDIDGGARWQGTSGAAGRVTLDYTSGANWAPRIGSVQLRSWAWDFRDAVDADNLLPLNYPNRSFYTRNVQAFVNSVSASANRTYNQSIRGETFGLPYHPADGTFTYAPVFVPFMGWFFTIVTALMAKAGIGGANVPVFVSDLADAIANVLEIAKFRGTFAGFRLPMTQDTAQTPFYTTYSAINAASADVPLDYSTISEGGDYMRNAIVAPLILSEAPGLSVALRERLRNAAVKLHSERQSATDGPPYTQDERFSGQNGMTNAIVPIGGTWIKTGTLPTIRNKTYTFKNDAVGQTVCYLEADGVLPRASAGLGTDAFTLVGTTGGLNVSLTRGGGVVLNASVTAGQSYTLTVNARVYDDDGRYPSTPGTLRTGPNQTITLNAVATLPVQPVISPDPGQITLIDNASAGTAIWAPTLLSGASGGTWSLFRNGTAFAINASTGAVTRGASGTVTAGQSLRPVVQYTSPDGLTAYVSVLVSVIPAPILLTAATTPTGGTTSLVRNNAITGYTTTVTPTGATGYAALVIGGVQQGVRSRFVASGTMGTLPDLTPTSSGTATIQVFAAATGGSPLATSANITISEPASGPALTLTNTPTFSTSVKKFGTHALTAGKGVAAATFPSTTSARTYECWYSGQGVTPSGSRQIMAFSQYETLTMDASGNLSLLYNFGSNNLDAAVGSTLYDNNWHHVVVSISPGSFIRIFWDGVQVAGNTASNLQALSAASANMIISASGADASGALYTGHGAIDEVRFSKVARYSATFTPPSAAFLHDIDTVALYHLDGDGVAAPMVPYASAATTPTGGPTAGNTNVAVTGFTTSLTPANGTAFAVLHNGTSEVGSRVSFTGTSLPSLTPTAAGTYTVQVFGVSSGGVALATSASITVTNATATAAATPTGGPTSGTINVALTGYTTSLTPSYAFAYACLHNGTADVGSRVVFNGTSIPSLTPTTTGTYTIKVYAASSGGSALATSASITITAVATAATTPTGGATTYSVNDTISGFTTTLTPSGAGAYAALIIAGSQVGSRQAFTGSTIPSFTASNAGTATIQIFAASTGGTALATSANLTINPAAPAFAWSAPTATYKEVFAISRRLNTSYTGPLIQVANSSGTTLDVGVDGSGNLNTAAIVSHAAGGLATVSKIYGQLGSFDLTVSGGTTTGPRITNASGQVLVGLGTNNRPRMQMVNGITNRIQSGSLTGGFNSFGVVATAARNTDTSGNRQVFVGLGVGGTYTASDDNCGVICTSPGPTDDSWYSRRNFANTSGPTNPLTNGTPYVVSALHTSTTASMRNNGTAGSAGPANATAISNPYEFAVGTNADGWLDEIVFLGAWQTSDISAIESNIRTWHGF